ncbi:succinate dehydrogenase, cytochrome b556 subunit [Pelagibacterium flavum]|uniref:Succinate dehydrogenase cytochrome b556 subunit n=1 Tax=Pelagibacterium flavum TaxID=2984530 RepID=A0ABY6IPW4_9HYPH|nr:succinate dehydrogenase, cytochrome b556 subunit [Pelagibacterium sp. YIM 151497]MAN77956.1 succinate dehydrogenase, cytochrome b556 subunit [Hyphomicrobiales bacterium]UYQ72434.1 succinate dehydrogenase, cytochrome b556 subunit [Pelagibacterium sp. YIM 151497]|eukprot:jgi/Tetstr1/452070/TSEL_039106.t1
MAHFRPTSPHLSIYRFTLTMTLSILHRVLGVGLYIGTVLFVLWLGAAALGQDQLSAVQGFFGHPIIQIGLFLYTWTLFQHMAGGLKHFFWDTGAGFDPASREAISLATLIFSAVATIVVWAVFVWF